MKKVSYERPQIGIVDYELEGNIADGQVISANGMRIEMEGQSITFP